MNLRKLCTNNPVVGYLKINSLRNNITQLRDVCGTAPADWLCIDETKLDASSQMLNFTMKVISTPRPFRRDGEKNSGEKMIFSRVGLVAKRSYSFEDNTSKNVCLEVSISKKK